MKRKKQAIQKGTAFKTIIINVAIICVLGIFTFAIYSSFFANRKNLNLPVNQMITRKGANLMLGNQPFRVVGVNDYDLAYRNNTAIEQTFANLHSSGVTTVRFWLFGDGNPDGFQPSPGNYNETRFKQADYVIFEAKKYDIKLIPTLVNNWTDYGGKDQYITWNNESPSMSDTPFYTDNHIKSLFENYIAYVLSRKNTYTNTTYADDPTILGWDIMNEPRATDQNEMNTWLISIAAFIKQHDPNHLVFAGTENATVTGNNPADEGKSSNLCANSAIDICSVHLYLFDQTQPLYSSYDQVSNFIQQQQAYAKQVNKPILLEEFGIAANTRPFGEDQLSVLQQIINTSKQNSYAGYLIWDWSDTPDSAFTFSPNGESHNGYSLPDLENLIK